MQPRSWLEVRSSSAGKLRVNVFHVVRLPYFTGLFRRWSIKQVILIEQIVVDLPIETCLLLSYEKKTMSLSQYTTREDFFHAKYNL